MKCSMIRVKHDTHAYITYMHSPSFPANRRMAWLTYATPDLWVHCQCALLGTLRVLFIFDDPTETNFTTLAPEHVSRFRDPRAFLH